ncbi:hypothetical protein QFZ74_003862 [Streptomyces sp. V3I7]|nr:hypothetical protein [Streptomyces sp. V3I7]
MRVTVRAFPDQEAASTPGLRPGSAGCTEIRVLFAFDPERNAVLLVAGDKSGQWAEWYRRAIPLAEQRYTEWLDHLAQHEKKGTQK